MSFDRNLVLLGMANLHGLLLVRYKSPNKVRFTVINGSDLKQRSYLSMCFSPFPLRIRESFWDSLQGKDTLNRLFNKNPGIIPQ